MKVVILNAGIGQRMGNLTKNKPKCLVKINERETILDHQLKNIIKSGLNDFIIPTGPFESQIINHINLHFPNINVEYINNPLYKRTNYIYSIFLAKEKVTEDILFAHGDLIFSQKLVKLLLDSKSPDCVLVNKSQAICFP